MNNNYSTKDKEQVPYTVFFYLGVLFLMFASFYVARWYLFDPRPFDIEKWGIFICFAACFLLNFSLLIIKSIGLAKFKHHITKRFYYLSLILNLCFLAPLPIFLGVTGLIFPKEGLLDTVTTILYFVMFGVFIGAAVWIYKTEKTR